MDLISDSADATSPVAPMPVGIPADTADGTSPPEGWDMREVVTDEVAYQLAWRDAERNQHVIEWEVRRARRLKREPFYGDPPREYDRYQRWLADLERQMSDIRAKYAGRPHVRMRMSLSGLGEGLVAARAATGIARPTSPAAWTLPSAQSRHWEACGYADLPLARLTDVLRALGFSPTADVFL